MERQKTQNGQHNTEEEKLYLKTYYRATIIKTVLSWQMDIQIGQRNRVDSPEIDPQKYSPLIFDKGTKEIQWSNDSLFNKLY